MSRAQCAHTSSNKVTPRESNPPAFSRASIVKRGKESKLLVPFKSIKKDKGQRNMSCAQLHNPSKLLKSCLKVKVKWFNELWCLQSDPCSWSRSGSRQWPFKSIKKDKGQRNMSCAQLHHPS